MAAWLAAVVLCGGLAACSSDDDPVPAPDSGNEDEGSEGAWPTAVGNIRSIIYDEKGRVTDMTTADGTVVYFMYRDEPIPGGANVEMDVDVPDVHTVAIRMYQDENGYVTRCEARTMTFEGVERDTWWFGYNADGQLNYMKRTEGGNEETFITYSNGDITHVRQTSDDADEGHWEQDILYTSGAVSTPVRNKGNIMLFDDAFGIDLDEMEYAYYAGFLGKATRHLPMGRNNGTADYYDWSFNSEGYPTSVVIDGNKTLFSW